LGRRDDLCKPGLIWSDLDSKRGLQMIQFCSECGRRLLNEWCVWCARQAQTTRVDRYEVRSSLGTGDFGTVLLARDPSLGRLVALRVVELKSGSPANTQSYVSTIGSIAGMSHPNCVDIYAVLKPSDGQAAFVVVMEYVAGPALNNAAKDLLPSEAILLLNGALSGLEFLHSHGISHGRLSPGNVLISATEVSKLADAGLGEDPDSPRAWALAAPEVLLGDGPSQAADVYSAAVIAWWLTSRQPPFVTNNRKHAVLLRHKGPHGQVPDQLRPTLTAALDIRPANRPTAAVLRTELASAADLWMPGWQNRTPVPALADC
jgi:serine/threonine protein kinase